MPSSGAIAWPLRRTLCRAKDSPAILNTQGALWKFQRSMSARDFERKIETFEAGNVIAIQIGNHEDWASILIACLRRRLVVLPLEQSIGDQQRDAALKICDARAVVSAVPSGNSPELFRLKTADATTNWGEHSPSLLKLTSGTTAAPRGIQFRSEQLLADCNQICDTMGIASRLNLGLQFAFLRDRTYSQLIAWCPRVEQRSAAARCACDLAGRMHRFPESCFYQPL